MFLKTVQHEVQPESALIQGKPLQETVGVMKLMPSPEGHVQTVAASAQSSQLLTPRCRQRAVVSTKLPKPWSTMES